jgi:glycine/D-amino acid oxidase-like deaminating enzyme
VSEASYRGVSFWLDTTPGSLEPRPALQGDTQVDVAIVGAGYTGLWTAYYLSRANPSLSVGVIEKEIAGFGASGRNGGWASGAFAAPKTGVARLHGRDAAIAMQTAVFDSIDEIERACRDNSIDAHFLKGGSLGVATNQPQKQRLMEAIEEDRSFGFDETDSRWLESDELGSRLKVEGALGGIWTPHCARLHPGRLIRGLAETVERSGVKIFEQTPALRLENGSVRTPGGRLKAPIIVLATEGYGARIRSRHRDVAPVYTHMVATEPLPSEFWKEVGWQESECVWDGLRMLSYAQRTADDRIAIGGSQADYPFASRTSASKDARAHTTAALRGIIGRYWPAVADAKITHSWGGAIGVRRDWFPSVGLEDGLAWAGGYVGDGVAVSNLAGRTLADLILGKDTDLTHLPWVGHPRRNWEPEPLRWLGIEGSLRLSGMADRSEVRTGKTPKILGSAIKLLSGL